MNKYNFSEQAIAEAAYYIWQNNGCPMNTSTQDWYAAINQLNMLANTKKTSLTSKKTFMSSLTNKALNNKKTSACKTSVATKKSACKMTVATKKSAKKSK